MKRLREEIVSSLEVDHGAIEAIHAEIQATIAEYDNLFSGIIEGATHKTIRAEVTAETDSIIRQFEAYQHMHKQAAESAFMAAQMIQEHPERLSRFRSGDTSFINSSELDALVPWGMDAIKVGVRLLELTPMMERMSELFDDMDRRLDALWAAKIGTIRWGKNRGADLSYDLLAGVKVDAELPALIGFDGSVFIWVFQGRVFCSKRDFSPDDVLALIVDYDKQEKRVLDRAHAMKSMGQQLDEKGKRQPIPQDVKMFVWQRDGGRCVVCGSHENLEFDHIIPLVMGGANTERNLQLLCEECNRKKGGSLG